VAVAQVTKSSVPSAPIVAPTNTLGHGYWHTDGTRIVDTQDRTVRIAAITWYGMETAYWVPAGLDFQQYTQIMDSVKRLGFNTIRLPYSNELVESNPIVTDKVAANPNFLGMHALQVMDAIVQYAHRIGLRIILDDHRCVASRRLTVNLLDEPLWYTAAYPESSWIRDWTSLARRYRNNDAVIGFDLRNEPHTDGPGPWNLHAYLNQGATWGPYHGVDNPKRDWRGAVERAGNAVLATNPHLLMFVEGLQLYPDAVSPNHMAAYWWGSILAPVRRYPVVFNVPHQLVYSPHDWGPLKYQMPWFRHMTYRSLQKIWARTWSFILNTQNATYTAPIWIGEFGTCTTLPTCVDQQRPNNQATWFHYLLRYLHDHPTIGWSFFAINGTNSNDNVANNGLLNGQWNGVANPQLQADLASIEP
jgi:endoglucanase